jgi:hypothetical protein
MDDFIYVDIVQSELVRYLQSSVHRPMENQYYITYLRQCAISASLPVEGKQFVRVNVDRSVQVYPTIHNYQH